MHSCEAVHTAKGFDDRSPGHQPPRVALHEGCLCVSSLELMRPCDPLLLPPASAAPPKSSLGSALLFLHVSRRRCRAFRPALLLPSVTMATPSSSTGFASQAGGPSVISYSYTDFPWRLLAYDIGQFFRLAWALPYIILPAWPSDSGHLAELSATRANVFCVAVHVVLCLLQLAFLLSLPCWRCCPSGRPPWAVGAFLALNSALCLLLNGRTIEYWSDPEYAPELPEHAHEQWVFLNGVAVG